MGHWVNKMTRSILGVLTLALALWASAPIGVAAAPIVSLQASAADVRPGDTLLIDVVATDFDDLYAFQFSLIFDPAHFQASALSEGDFLQSAGATFFIPGEIDNATGAVSFTANTLIGPGPGANGGGLLARFQFDATAVGSGGFDLADLLFLDSSLVDVFPSVTPVDIEVTTSNVPEPSSLLLMIAALAVLGALKADAGRLVPRVA